MSTGISGEGWLERRHQVAIEVLSRLRLRTHLSKRCKRCSGGLHLERATDTRLGEEEYDYVCLRCGHPISTATLVEQLRDARTAA
jgi:hypothetical protein